MSDNGQPTTAAETGAPQQQQGSEGAVQGGIVTSSAASSSLPLQQQHPHEHPQQQQHQQQHHHHQGPPPPPQPRPDQQQQQPRQPHDQHQPYHGQPGEQQQHGQQQAQGQQQQQQQQAGQQSPPTSQEARLKDHPPHSAHELSPPPPLQPMHPHEAALQHPPPPHHLQQHQQHQEHHHLQHQHHQAHHEVDHDHEHELRHHSDELSAKRAKMDNPQVSHVSAAQMPMTSQGIPISMPMHRLEVPNHVLQSKPSEMLPPSDACPGIKKKGCKTAPCGNFNCLKCLQVNCCKRCPNPRCGQWSPIARRVCRGCNHPFTTRAQEQRRKHASFTEHPKDSTRTPTPSAFEQSLQRKVSSFYNSRDGIFLGFSIYSSRAVVTRLFHNQTSFLAPTLTGSGGSGGGGGGGHTEWASAEEVAQRPVEVADPLLGNNPIVTTCIRHLQQDILRQVERMEEMLRDYLTVTATQGNRARKCAEKLVNSYHPSGPQVQQLPDPGHKPEHHQQHHQQHTQHQHHQHQQQQHPPPPHMQTHPM